MKRRMILRQASTSGRLTNDSLNVAMQHREGIGALATSDPDPNFQRVPGLRRYLPTDLRILWNSTLAPLPRSFKRWHHNARRLCLSLAPSPRRSLAPSPQSPYWLWHCWHVWVCDVPSSSAAVVASS